MILTSVNLLIVFLHTFSNAQSVMKTYGLQELCSSRSTGTLILESPNWGASSSAILIPSSYSSYAENTNCSVIIQSNVKANGIVISIRKIDLRPNNLDTLRIRYAIEPNSENEKVYRTSGMFRNKREDPMEQESYISIKNATIIFETGYDYPNKLYTEGFEMTVTTVSDICGSSKIRCGTGMCIAEVLKCDGHNHCGDRSEQHDCGNEYIETSSDMDSTSRTVMITLLVVIGGGIATVVLVYLYCRNKCDCDSLNASDPVRTNISHIQTSSASNHVTTDYPLHDPTYGSRNEPPPSYSTYEADSAATCYSTYEPTYEADSAAPCYSTYEPTYEADNAATCYSTYEPTYEADSAATCYSTYDSTYEAESAATCDSNYD